MNASDEKLVDKALAEAHLPALVMSIVHLTGDTSLLKGERPVYALFDERQRRLSGTAKTLIRQQARAAIIDFMNSRLRQMKQQLEVGAQYVASSEIPEIPEMAFGSKGALRDHGAWIATLRSANVELVTANISEIIATGIRTADGVHHGVDHAVDERNKGMAWGAAVATNGYKNAAGRISQNWPSAIVDNWYATPKAQPENLIPYGKNNTLQSSAATI